MKTHLHLPSLREGLLDTRSLARELGVRRETLSRMVHDPSRGAPQGIRLGRKKYYDVAEFREWIRAKTTSVPHSESVRRARP